MKNSKMKSLSNKPYAGRLFLLVLFLAIETFIVLFFLKDYSRHVDQYGEQLLRAFDASYRGATTGYDYTTRVIFDDVINKPEVLKLIAAALDDDKKRDVCRNELYRLMLPSYEKQKTIGILQFHFNLKDGTSFLRMHAPEQYGDNLFGRTAVYQVNNEQMPVKGYEVGYSADGYRLVYPLFYNGRHIGSVEFGITSEGIINHLKKIYPAHYLFMIDRTIVDNMTYADWKNLNYRENGLSDHFMIGQTAAGDPLVASINQKLGNKVRDRLARMYRFVEKETVDGKNYLISFIPIRDVKGDAAAYFIQYINDDYVAHQSGFTIIDITLFTLLLAAIFCSIDNIQNRRKSLEQKNIEFEQLTDKLQQFKLLAQYARDIILFIGIDGRIIEANEAAEKTYGYTREELASLHIKDLRSSSTQGFIEGQMKIANEKGLLFETEHRRRDGSTFPAEVSSVGVDVGNRRVLLSIIRDITERRKADDLIRKREAELNESQRLAHIGSWDWDARTDTIWWSDEYYRIYKLDPEQPTPHYMEHLKAYTTESSERLDAAVKKAMETGEPYELDLELAKPDAETRWITARAEVKRDAGGWIWGLRGTAQNITERKLIEEAMKTSEERYRTLFEGSPDAIFLADPETGEIVDANPEASRLLKRPLNEIIGMHQSQLHPLRTRGRSKEEFTEHVDKAFRRAEVQPIENMVLCSDGTEVPVDILAQMVTIKGRRLLQGVFRNITRHKKAEEALRESEEIFRSFMEYSPIYVFFKDENIRSIRLSRNYETMLGRPIDELLGKSMDDLFPSDLAKRMIADDMRIMREGKTISVEEEFNGRLYSTVKFPIHIDGKPRYLAGYTIDITERRKDEERIKKALVEKETLLREIHHRVKNNMQVITSLLNLQAQKIEDKNLRKPFKESEQRIRAMALVHERLYQKGYLSSINFSDYIHNIIRELKAAYRIDGRKVAIKINVEDIVLEIDSAIPCGLIINELITNCFKYAFPEDMSGEVNINFTKEGKTYKLTIRDNGIGLPAGFDYRQTTTLGMQIASVLTKQLLGSFRMRSDGGTEAVISFAKKERTDGEEENAD
jgi:PAS domain S-box-containing protein